MNRLQKKCVIATAGFHLLLLVILFVGPAFFWAREKPDDTPVLDVIPANLVDAALTAASKAPSHRPRQHRRQSQRRRSRRLRPHQNRLSNPRPRRTPTFTERVEKFFKPEPVKAGAGARQKTEPHTPKVNLTLTTRTVPKNTSTPSQTDTRQFQGGQFRAPGLAREFIFQHDD